MSVDQLMMNYLRNGKAINESLKKEMDETKELNSRSDYFNYLFLYGQDARLNNRKREIRYCVSNMIQLMQDQNKSLYIKLQWDRVVPTQEHIEFLDYGMQLSDRLFTMETYKAITLNFVMTLAIIAITWLVFKKELSYALSIGSVFFILDAILLIIVRKKKTHEIVSRNINKSISVKLVELEKSYKSHYE